ncbi:lipoate--protein ligase family protein [Romeria aff. gracilis LEGE 07310]|uniref:Lipoate--protein ligase family protein n=1 Tax=Vasconcelosia minhoensis LEGE 07310 TaxID=915328 RepID=A0A8J7AYC1_9CYAN|nr:lipoate--protein ligase family protein [Romeria gracilis]MBE9080013.1 lipoate--protein ligase family protein [Romeria aff. gracilis LEGE 07310]
MDSNWRLIPLMDGAGELHMAIDRWLLNQQQPCLRFYTWQPAAISLGYHQRQWPQHWRSISWRGQPIDLLRRPTGGRAVLHQGELTYALITPVGQGSRRAVYQALCQFLILGWRRLGITLDFGTARGRDRDSPDCFGTATAADLVTPAGYKLIGSAQVYRQGYVLQHGSMRLQPSAELFERVFGSAIASPPLPPHLKQLTLEQQHMLIEDALTEAAAACFEVILQARPLSVVEISAAQAWAKKATNLTC